MDLTRSAKKVIRDYSELRNRIQAHRMLDERIVVTIGSWDALHIGHVRYLIKGSEQGSILVVGVDSDRVMKTQKGPLRPAIPEQERMEMLSYQEIVTYVTLVDDLDVDNQWDYGLIRALEPDVFIAVEDSYPEDQLTEIKQHCGEVVVLPRQAETSTSKTLHDATIRSIGKLGPRLLAKIIDVIGDRVKDVFEEETIAKLLREIEEEARGA